jgi:hypothetical protein
MSPRDPKDITESTTLGKFGSSTQAGKPDSKSGAPSSNPANDTGRTAIEAELKLQNQQDDRVYSQILRYLDWNEDHKDPEPAFQPFYLFVSKELRKQKPDLEKLVGKLKELPATRLVRGGGTETGFAWEFNDKSLAMDLSAGVKMQKPDIFLGYDLVTINGTAQPCQVVYPLSVA